MTSLLSLKELADKVKYIDESHFVPYKITKSRFLGKQGKPVFVIPFNFIHKKSFTLTLFLTLKDSEMPFRFYYNTNTNKELDAMIFLRDRYVEKKK